MTEMSDTDRRNAMKRVPVWAQREIENLQRKVADQARHIAQLSAGPEDSDVRVHHYGDTPDQLLGKGTEITFDVGEPYGPDGSLRDRVTVEPSRDRPGWLDIHIISDRAGAQALFTYPVVSNHIRLGVGPY